MGKILVLSGGRLEDFSYVFGLDKVEEKIKVKSKLRKLKHSYQVDAYGIQLGPW